jgi:arylsulfatase A-like enzyme
MGFSSAIPNTTDGENFATYLMTGKGKKPDSQWYMRISDGNTAGGLRGVRTERYTFVIDQGKDNKRKELLFDRLKDPYQMKNIAAERADLVGQLTTQMKEWLVKYQDPWLKNIQ